MIHNHTDSERVNFGYSCPHNGDMAFHSASGVPLCGGSLGTSGFEPLGYANEADEEKDQKEG